MKASIFSAACALILSGAAQGANPFSDVDPSHWSYRSVQRLAEAGVVEGDPGGAFRGERPLTRWEMAQVTARLLAREDRLTPDERAETARLAEEYAEELASLGVRATKAEAQAGQITWRGEMRTAYQKWTENKDNGKNHVRTGRLRLMMRGDVNDTTYAAGRLTTGDIDFESGDSGDLSMDRLYVRHAFGPARLTLGRYELDLGVQDRWLYGNAFDGAELAADLTDRVSVRAGAGRFRGADRNGYSETDDRRFAGVVPDGGAFGDADAFYAGAEADFGLFRLGADYYHASSFTNEWGRKGKSSVYGVHAVLPMDDFRAFGEYYKDTDAAGDPAVWTVGLGYGAVRPEKRWSLRADIAYFHADAGLYHKNMTGLDIDDAPFLAGGHFWLATGTINVGKNIDMHGEYAFGQESDHGRNTGDTWMVSTRYHF